LALDLGCRGKKRVGVIGLGAGTLAVYGNSGDVFRFYEINPQVIEVAKSYFSFLRKSSAQIEIVPGDARLSLESEPPQNYDVLAVDAFSGDAIPVHLLTKEAFALYLRHLKPDGILAIHTSNLYLDLAPVVQLLADSFGYPAVCIENEKEDADLIDLTDWVVVTKKKGFMELPQCQSEKKEIVIPRRLMPWTDDYNSLFTLFK
jgi:SAM-dependent methyltransferase